MGIIYIPVFTLSQRENLSFYIFLKLKQALLAPIFMDKRVYLENCVEKGARKIDSDENVGKEG